MHKIIEWIKSNKIVSILILFFIFYIFNNNTSVLSGGNYSKSYNMVEMASDSVGLSSSYSRSMPMMESAANVPDGAERMVVGTYNISSLVKDAKGFLDSVSAKVSSLGGFVVSSNLRTPESTTASGNVSLRIPSQNLAELKSFIADSSVKIVSENKSASDVTDQYYDNAARMDTLNKTKAIYEDMLDKAVTVEEVMKVQQQIINIQTQIDSVKGRQMYLEKTTSTVIVSLNFSTDELELPYAPENKFRPAVVFKYAVRGLLTTFASLGTKAIWIAVYSVIWVPLLVVFLLVKKYLKRKQENK